MGAAKVCAVTRKITVAELTINFIIKYRNWENINDSSIHFLFIIRTLALFIHFFNLKGPFNIFGTFFLIICISNQVESYFHLLSINKSNILIHMLILIRESQQILKQVHPLRFQFPRIHSFLRILPPRPKVSLFSNIT